VHDDDAIELSEHPLRSQAGLSEMDTSWWADRAPLQHSQWRAGCFVSDATTARHACRCIPACPARGEARAGSPRTCDDRPFLIK